MSKLTFFTAIVAAAFSALLVGGAHPAKATFPGADGRIAYAHFDANGTTNIYTVEPDGTGTEQLTNLTPDKGGASEPAWSPDGSEIVYTVNSPDFSSFKLWIMNADGTNQRPLFNEGSGYNDFQGNWSPDGSRVIFRRCSTMKEECSIYTIKSDGRALNQITQPVQNAKNGNADVKPEFSPDGNTISFASFNRGGVQNGIYLMGLHGTGIQLITPPALGAVDADWSPGGTKIAFWTHCCNSETSTIDTMNPDGSGIMTLTSPGTSNDLRPSYSPQGDMIVFERDNPDFTSDIETMPAGGGTPTMLVAHAETPSWGTAS
jgi:Tol biopolymer transport system component